MTLITTLPVESYSPVYVGDTGAIFAPLILDDANNTINLTGATLSTRMVSGTTVKTWDPTKWVIDDAAGGRAHYNYQATDVDTPGRWLVQTAIAIGGKPLHTDVRELLIETPV